MRVEGYESEQEKAWRKEYMDRRMSCGDPDRDPVDRDHRTLTAQGFVDWLRFRGSITAAEAEDLRDLFKWHRLQGRLDRSPLMAILANLLRLRQETKRPVPVPVSELDLAKTQRDKAMRLLNRAESKLSDLEAAPDPTWWREYFLLTGEHMIQTEEGWEAGCQKQTYPQDEIIDEVNAPKVEAVG